MTFVRLFSASSLRNAFACLTLCLSFLLGENASAQTSNLPDVTLKNVKGESVQLGKYATSGHPTVISFWATWCSPCKKELTNIVELYPEWKSKYNVEVVAISIDDARNSAKVKSYVDGVRWPYEILLDPNEDLKRSLNFQTVPYTILLDSNGKIVYTHNSYVEGDELILEDKIAALTSGKPVGGH